MLELSYWFQTLHDNDVTYRYDYESVASTLSRPKNVSMCLNSILYLGNLASHFYTVLFRLKYSYSAY